MLQLIVLIFGLVIGSFLNVVIDRVPGKEDIVVKRSYCDRCRKKIKWYDLIPLLSFVLLKRRCRYCREKISWQYPLVELAAGALFLGTFTRFSYLDLSFANIVFLSFFLYSLSVLLVIFVTDIKYLIVPDKILLPAIFISILVSLAGLSL